MRPLTISLPPEVFAEVVAGRKRVVSTRRNPRKDRYFLGKRPAEAKINGLLFRINGIEGTETEWHVHLASDPGKCKHPPDRLHSWSGKDSLGKFTAVCCCLCGSVLHC